MPNINDEISKMPELSEAQFHTVWTEAVGLEGYNKRLFQQVFVNLVRKGKITSLGICPDCETAYKSSGHCPECFS